MLSGECMYSAIVRAFAPLEMCFVFDILFVKFWRRFLCSCLVIPNSHTLNTHTHSRSTEPRFSQDKHHSSSLTNRLSVSVVFVAYMYIHSIIIIRVRSACSKVGSI